MIKLESVHIEGVRGIARKLELDFQRKSFAISGPNGSGKSAVIDAVEFALTGQISRLEGTGTKALSVTEHGPHVDKAKAGDPAFVKLGVYIPKLNKSATITRKLKSPKKSTIEPDDTVVKTVLAEVADHPEIALSRRDIIRFILVEPSKRSAEIQALLKLDEIGATRSALNTAQNRLQTSLRSVTSRVKAASDALCRHVEIDALTSDQLLAAVNLRRKVLNLEEISELTAETALDEGLTGTAKTSAFDKASALRDLDALSEAAKGSASLCATEAAQITADLIRLEADPSLLAIFQRRSFIEKGLELVEGPECPLCDTPWKDEEALRAHLQVKLAKSEEAGRLRESLETNGAAISDELIRIVALIDPTRQLAISAGQTAFADTLAAWEADLSALKPKLATADDITGFKDRFAANWVREPAKLSVDLKALTDAVKSRPDQTATFAAQTFLSTAQMRLQDYRSTMRDENAAKAAAAAAKVAYETYCATAEAALDKLYKDVQGDFGNYYRALNGDDESNFTAKFTPSEGKLDLEVDFYERGLFPPNAYHSEGHQDGMGVCLYLALMKRLFRERFSLALLDDVVMSVDTGHRYEFCKILKENFPDTQFIITTHDRLWAEQMKSAGLVTSKTSATFHGWTIDTGPIAESNEEIWDEIDRALTKGKVEVAAAALRHHLEYAFQHLADQTRARPRYRADGRYELSEMMSSVLTRMRRLLGKAADSAQSWGKLEERDAIAERRASLASCNGAAAVQEWAVNKAVHYNEWANFDKKDFEPVVASFRDLLDRFRCAACDSWLHVTPRQGSAESLRCSCDEIRFNLTSKAK